MQTAEEAFHAFLRKVIVLFLSFLFMLFFSMYILRYLLRIAISKLQVHGSDDIETIVSINNGRSLVLWICSLALSMSISSWLLVPSSILVSELVLRIGAGSWINWMDESLVQGYWDTIFVGSNISLFFLLPFGYFYSEAEEGTTVFYGFWFNKKIREAMIVWVLVAAAVYGLSQTIKSILELQQADFLVVLCGICVVVSAFNSLWHYPAGISAISSYILKIPMSPFARSKIMQDLNQLEMEENSLKLRQEKLKSSENDGLESRVSWKGTEELAIQDRDRIETNIKIHRSKEEEQIQQDIDLVLIEKNKLKQKIGTPIFVRNLVFGVLFIIHFGGAFLMTTQLILNNIKGTLTYLRLIEETTQYSFSKVNMYLLSAQDVLSIFHAFMETLLSIYFQTVCLVGMISKSKLEAISIIRDNDLKGKGLSIPSILTSVTLLLVQTTSNPLMLRIIGLTRFELIGYYGIYKFYKSYYLITVLYQFLFLAVMISTVLGINSLRINLFT